MLIQKNTDKLFFKSNVCKKNNMQTQNRASCIVFTSRIQKDCFLRVDEKNADKRFFKRLLSKFNSLRKKASNVSLADAKKDTINSTSQTAELKPLEITNILFEEPEESKTPTEDVFDILFDLGFDFDISIVSYLSRLDSITKQRAVKLLKSGIDIYYAVNIAKLNDIQYQRALEFLDQGKSPSQAMDIAQLDEMQRKRALYLIDKKVNFDDIKNIAQLDNMQYQRALSLLDKNIGSYCASHLAQLDEIQYQKALKMIDEGDDPFYILRVAHSGDVDPQKVLELHKKNVEPEIAKTIAQFNEVQYQRALNLLNKYVNDENSMDIAKLDDTQYQRALKMIDDGVYSCYALDIAQLDDIQYQRALYLFKRKIKAENIKSIVQLDDIQYQRVLGLLDKKVYSANARDIALFDDASYQKVLNIINKGVHSCYAMNIAQLDDAQYQKALSLIDSGVDESCVAMLCKLDNVQYQRALKLLDTGDFKPELFENIVYFNDNQYQRFIDLIKSGVMDIEAEAIVAKEAVRENYEYFLLEGMNLQNAFIAANIKNSRAYSHFDISKLIDSIKRTGFVDKLKVSKEIEDFLIKNPDADIVALSKYMDKLDFSKLSETVPEISEFNIKQRLIFANHHYQNGAKTEFALEDLILPDDFTKYLTDNYVDADKLTEILTIFPATSRNVGQIPNDWLSAINPKEYPNAIDEIFKTLTSFVEHKNTGLLTLELSDILKKEVEVETLRSGTYGTGHIIMVDGAKSVCLKTFHSAGNCVHGEHIEVQAGLFVNKHSSDFVKMYFGRVSPEGKRDGFLVTQFLGAGIKPDEVSEVSLTRFSIKSSDIEDKNIGHNVIKGKIIDYGGVIVEKK